jgi:hypothetical protein
VGVDLRHGHLLGVRDCPDAKEAVLTGFDRMFQAVDIAAEVTRSRR